MSENLTFEAGFQTIASDLKSFVTR